jgi:hypothetical protein
MTIVVMEATQSGILVHRQLCRLGFRRATLIDPAAARTRRKQKLVNQLAERARKISFHHQLCNLGFRRPTLVLPAAA